MNTKQENQIKIIADFIGLKYGENREFKSGRWIFPLKSLNASFSTWEYLFHILKVICEKTSYELVMKEQESYWNKEGYDPLNKVFGGYCNASNIRQAIVEFIEHYNNTQDDNH